MGHDSKRRPTFAQVGRCGRRLGLLGLRSRVEFLGVFYPTLLATVMSFYGIIVCQSFLHLNFRTAVVTGYRYSFHSDTSFLEESLA